jgi:hypothetical protein
VWRSAGARTSPGSTYSDLSCLFKCVNNYSSRAIYSASVLNLS